MSITCFDSDGNVLKSLYQWDNNQTLTVQGLDMPPIPVFHFCNRLSKLALVVNPTVSGNAVTVNIPNILLQMAEPIIAYVYQDTENDGYRTMHAIHIPVIPRPKPDDYEYEDNIDYISVAVLNSRLNTLLKSMSSLATVVYVDEKFGSIPAWAKTSEKPTYTAEEVGAISTADLQTATDAALAQAKASGMFDGDPGKDGITPTIGDNGNWYLGETDTGKPSRGAKGDPGAAGHSPAVTATKSGDVTTVKVDGEAVATINDGKNGKTPVRGTDYWTEADKQEMVNEVLAALPDGTEVEY